MISQARNTMMIRQTNPCGALTPKCTNHEAKNWGMQEIIVCNTAAIFPSQQQTTIPFDALKSRAGMIISSTSWIVNCMARRGKQTSILDHQSCIPDIFRKMIPMSLNSFDSVRKAHYEAKNGLSSSTMSVLKWGYSCAALEKHCYGLDSSYPVSLSSRLSYLNAQQKQISAPSAPIVFLEGNEGVTWWISPHVQTRLQPSSC